jgi:hypothetical protein
MHEQRLSPSARNVDLKAPSDAIIGSACAYPATVGSVDCVEAHTSVADVEAAGAFIGQPRELRTRHNMAAGYIAGDQKVKGLPPGAVGSFRLFGECPIIELKRSNLTRSNPGTQRNNIRKEGLLPMAFQN